MDNDILHRSGVGCVNGYGESNAIGFCHLAMQLMMYVVEMPLQGRIGISVQIVPEQEAQMNPVGKAQEAPNMNPYLPPPVGRMRLSANPIMMLKELIGPKMCLRITILFCCVGCAFFIGVFGATIMSTLTYIQGMSRGDSSGGRAPLQLPGNLRYPFDFQDPKNSSAIGGNSGGD